MQTIVFHAPHYYPSTKPVCRLYLDIIKILIEHKYQVIVITAKNGQAAYSFHGETVIGVNNLGYLRENILCRLLDYSTFSLQAFFTSHRITKKNKIPKHQIINVVKSGYGITAIIAMINKKIYNSNIVFWMLDRYPDIFFQNITKFKLYNILFRVLKFIEIYSLNNLNKIIFETESDRNDYYNNKGVTPSTIVRTWPSVIKVKDYIKPNFWNEEDLANKDVVTYSGNIGNSFDQGKLIKIANHYPHITFLILGSGSKYLDLCNKILHYKINNIIIEPYLPDPEYNYILRNSKYGLVLLNNGLDVFSSKITAYLSFNIPIIGAIDSNNEMASIIQKYNCGIVIANQFSPISTKGKNYEKLVFNTKKAKKIFDKQINSHIFIQALEL